MNRPHDYDEPRVTVRNINYHCEDDQFNAMHTTGGVLCKGQIVWIRRCPTFAYSVSAYVEGIGLVTIDPRFLVRLPAEDRKVEMDQKLPFPAAQPTLGVSGD